MNDITQIHKPTHFTVGDLAEMFEVDLSDAQHIVSTVTPSSYVNGVPRWYLKDVARRFSLFLDGYIPNPKKFTAQEKMDWNSGTVIKKQIEAMDRKRRE